MKVSFCTRSLLVIGCNDSFKNDFGIISLQIGNMLEQIMNLFINDCFSRKEVG